MKWERKIRGKISNQKRLKETFAEYVCINYARSPRMKVIKRSGKRKFSEGHNYLDPVSGSNLR